ncbi:MAG: AsmA family protein [Balneolales bacterium]|nr:AsmA family protein [Balneolales bacterium]
MKIFLRIAAVLAGLLVVIIIALNLYLTDERLKELIIPPVNEALGTEVEVSRIGFTIFRTFPNFGLVMEGFNLPDETGESVVRFDELLLSVNLLPLLGGEVNINRLDVIRAEVLYHVRADGTTNIDFLLGEPVEQEEPAGSMVIDVNQIRIVDANIRYLDDAEHMEALLRDLDVTMSVRLGEFIETDVDARLAGLTFRSEGTTLVNDLALRLEQTSTLDLEGEVLEIASGVFSIRGLGLSMSGSIADWSQDVMQMNLDFQSSSDNFGALLDLVPDEYREYVAGIESRGQLQLSASVNGGLGEDQIPDFLVNLQVEDGFLRHPQAEKPVENVFISLQANNNLIELRQFSAVADGNRVSVQGRVDNPLSDNPAFTLDADMNIDLATIESFYPVSELGVELRGRLAVVADARGVAEDVENTRFNANVTLENGFFRYTEAPQPVEDIQIQLTANQDRIDIESFRARASQNTLQLSGSITQPLDEARTAFNMNADARFDLATIKDFYPIDEDTLLVRGMFVFDGSARGTLAALDNAAISGTMNLTDGYIRHRDIAHPIENIRIRSQLTATEVRLSDFGLKAADNTFEGSGTIRNYMRGSPEVNISMKAAMNLDQVEEFYSLEEFMMTIGGRVDADLTIRGPIDDFDRIRFNGGVQVRNVHIQADSLLPVPLREMNGSLTFTEQDVRLQEFAMLMGRSDFFFEGNLARWRNLLEEPGTVQPAMLTATYRSRKVDIDEFINWDEETESEPFILELPNLETRLTASVDTLIMMGIEITEIRGRAESDTRSIRMPEATARMYDGGIGGRLVWDVTRPDYFDIHFVGELNDVRAETFLRDFQMGGAGKLHEYLSGGFSATTDYKVGMDAMFEQDTASIVASGNFGVARARMRNHPIQNGLADLLGNNEFRDMSLDTFNAQYTIRDGILTLTDLNITSRDIGMVMNGTQNLIEDRLNYKIRLRLPERYDAQLGRLLTAQVVEALKAQEGIVVLPLALVGSSENPRITIDQDEVQRIAAEYLRQRGVDSVEDAARRLIRGLQRN